MRGLLCVSVFQMNSYARSEITSRITAPPSPCVKTMLSVNSLCIENFIHMLSTFILRRL